MAEPTPRSVDLLLDRVRDSPALVQQIKDEPLTVLEELAKDVKRNNPINALEDVITFRIAVIVLAIAVMIVVGCVTTVFVWSVLTGKQHPNFSEFLVAIGSTALGALAGLLAPVQRRNN
ncbi:hypothetical protein [Neorhizobium sp. DT-125]|uniref:hypothetical protein n=1 Tax=Neorhizobium sp. DT-125 TaxID=3396163 RepID=UPI003F1B76B4